MSLKPPKIILASTSIRRHEILKLLGLPFETRAPRYEEESLEELTPYEEALRFSIEKSKSLASLYPDSILIGSDTLLEFKGEKIGKPQNFEHALEILKKLRGDTHDILTGVCLLNAKTHEIKSGIEIIQVKMKNYSEGEIKNYIEKDKPFDKAGAYALQGEGKKLIESLKGDYLAAVGLPLRFIAAALREFGVLMPRDVEQIYQEKKLMNWKEY